ncbi:hypothetical protein [Helicobacter typhlonius]|uniref:hypothetical protein n=1 Tax=Helicobacter typhlonius TaxID=76936 RepID=UPI002FE01CB1
MKQKKSLGRKILREILRLLYKLCSRLWTYAKGGKPMSKAEIAQDKADYTRLNADERFKLDNAWDYLCLEDKYAQNGTSIDKQYFIQDIWGAQKVLEYKPSVHYDVGSSVNGFIAHLLAQKQKVVLFDIRPMDNQFDTRFLKAGGGGGGGGNLYPRKCHAFSGYCG